MRSVVTRRKTYDALAIGLSLLCLVHCLALPVLILALPAVTVWVSVPESAHAVVLALAIPASAVALTFGFRAHHAGMPTAIALIGLALLCFGVFGAESERAETIATVIGGLLLAFAHALNLRALPRGGSQ